MSDSDKRVGENIRIVRRKRNLKQKELSALAGISPSFLGMVERGSRGLSPDNLNKLCNVLDVTVDDVLNHDLNKMPIRSRASKAGRVREDGKANNKISRINVYLKEMDEEALDVVLGMVVQMQKYSSKLTKEKNAADKEIKY